MRRLTLSLHRWVVAGGVLTAASAVLALFEPQVAFVTAVLLVLEASLIAREVLELRRRARDYQIVGGRDLQQLHNVRLSDRYQGWRRIRHPAGIAILSDELNRLLWDAPPLALIKDPSRYRLPQLARELGPVAIRNKVRRGRIVHDDPKVRLCSDLTPDLVRDAAPVTWQRTSYFAGEMTNELTGVTILSTRTGQIVHDGSELAVNRGTLVDLSNERLSNQLGGSTLAFTNDGHLILPIQTGDSSQSPNLYAPSGSGSFDLEDAERAATLQQLAIMGMERELAEECGLDRDRIAMSTRIIGFTRLMHRGGKPEFLGLTYLDVPSSHPAVSRRERAFIGAITRQRVDRSEADRLRASLDDVEAEHRAQLSVPLLAALEGLRTQLDTRPEEVVAHIRGHLPTQATQPDS